MNKLNYISQFIGNLGIPNHAKFFGLALEEQLDKINWIQYEYPRDSPHKKDYKRYFKELWPLEEDVIDLNGDSYDKNAHTLIFWYPRPEYFFKRSYNKPTLGYYIFEYTIIPPDWVRAINGLDGVCVASLWHREVLRKNGVEKPIYIVPGGVDTDYFCLQSKEKIDSDIFKFLHVGKFENRKGTDILIKAFKEAFGDDPKIRLVLSIDNPHVQDFNAKQAVARYTSNQDNIDIVNFVEDIRALYWSCDCGVWPSRAEGIGLPIVEAMACGLPVIIPKHSGITDYATEENCFLIEDFREEPIYDPLFFPNPGQFGFWYSVPQKTLVNMMLKAYATCRSDLIMQGIQGSIYLENNYTWHMAAKNLVNIIKEDTFAIGLNEAKRTVDAWPKWKRDIVRKTKV